MTIYKLVQEVYGTAKQALDNGESEVRGLDPQDIIDITVAFLRVMDDLEKEYAGMRETNWHRNRWKHIGQFLVNRTQFNKTTGIVYHFVEKKE